MSDDTMTPFELFATAAGDVLEAYGADAGEEAESVSTLEVDVRAARARLFMTDDDGALRLVYTADVVKDGPLATAIADVLESGALSKEAHAPLAMAMAAHAAKTLDLHVAYALAHGLVSVVAHPRDGSQPFAVAAMTEPRLPEA